MIKLLCRAIYFMYWGWQCNIRWLLEPGLMETGEESAGRGDTAQVTRSRGPMLWVIRIRRQALENSCLQYYIFRKEGFIDINDIIQLACMLDGRAPWGRGFRHEKILEITTYVVWIRSYLNMFGDDHIFIWLRMNTRPTVLHCQAPYTRL